MLYSSRTWQRCCRHLCGITQHSTDTSRKLQRVLLGETEIGCGLWQYVHCKVAQFSVDVGNRKIPYWSRRTKSSVYKSENQGTERSDPRSPRIV